MQQLQNSKLKTERSAIDNISVNDVLPSSDYAERAQQLASIYQWLNKRASNGSLGDAQQLHLQNQQYSYFMAKIDSLSHLPFRRVHKLSKIHVHLIGSLINLKTGAPQRKCTRIIKQLQQTNSSLFQLKESICLYFYSSNQVNLLLRIQVLISQQFLLQQESDNQISIHSPCQSLGFIEIELAKEVKVKEKKVIRHPGEVNLFYREQSNQIKGAHCSYYLVRSQAYKYLERVVKPNTLCDCTDRIPGVMGHLLPINQNTLSDFTITPEAQGLLLQFNNIEFSPSLLKDTQAKCQKYAKSIYSSASNLTFSSKDLVLRASFHNGWKVVSWGQSTLKQKEGIRVNTNNSFVSGLHHNKSKENISIIRQFDGGLKRHSGNNIYNAQKNIELGLTFPGEQQCMLILQVNANITVTVEYAKPKEQKQVDILKEVVQIPVCFALISAKGMTLHRFQTLRFYPGCALASQTYVLEMIAKQMTQLQVTMNQKKSVRRLQIQRDNFSAMKSIKTISNATLISTKKIIGELGMVQFQLHFREKDAIAISAVDNLSILMDNISGINTSRVDLKDKINAEKDRISKEAKKALQVKKKMGVQFYNEIVISQNQKGQILLGVTKPSSSKKDSQRQELLLYLKHFLPELTALQREGSGYLQQQVKKPLMPRPQKMIYYPLKITITRRELPFQSLQLPTIFYLLHSNYQFTQNRSYHIYEDIPIDIIRTELSQLNYNNLFFFNFLNIIPSLHESLYKFPKSFFLKTRFWNQPEIRSQLLSINKDTGEIVLFGSQGSSEETAKSKIMHIEIGFDQSIQNYQVSFIHFIQYLYNGLLTIEIVDYSTGHTFGTLMLPLRMLIRKRRNEAIFTHEDYIYHRNYTRGRVRVEMRALRKIKQKINKKTISPDGTLEQSRLPEKPESKDRKGEHFANAQLKEVENKRIMERIMKFKQGRTKRSSPKKSPKKGINGQQIQDIQHQQYKKIQHLFNDKYVNDKKVLKVSYLKKYFFFINLENKHDQPSTLRIAVNDEDAQCLSGNPLSHGEQLTVVKDISLLQKGDRQKIFSIKKYQQKIDKCLKLVHQSLVQLQAREKGTLLLCYFSVRKYKDWSDVDQQVDLLSIYNRERTINLSLINHLNGTVETVSSIQVIPVPDETNIELEYYRPSKERSAIHLPFIEPSFICRNIDQILIDDPYILVTSAQNSQVTASDRKGPLSFQKGVVLQIANDIQDQQCRQVNVLLVNSAAQKQQEVNHSHKQQKSRMRSKLQVMQVVSNGPPMINLTLKIWGCYKFSARVDLWHEEQLVFKLQTHLFASKMSTHCFYVFSQNEELLKIRKNQRLKYQRPELFTISKENESIDAYCDIFSGRTGYSCININIVEAKSVLDQQQALAKHEFKEVAPIYRIVLCLETVYPVMKEVIRININRSAQQKIIEEPFSYRSSCFKKTSYKVLTSDSSLLWVKNSDSTFQLEPKAEQKVSILFHIDQIIDNSSVTGVCDNAILGVKWDKGIDYFSFRFNIY